MTKEINFKVEILVDEDGKALPANIVKKLKPELDDNGFAVLDLLIDKMGAKNNPKEVTVNITTALTELIEEGTHNYGIYLGLVQFFADMCIRKIIHDMPDNNIFGMLQEALGEMLIGDDEDAESED